MFSMRFGHRVWPADLCLMDAELRRVIFCHNIK